MKPKVVFVCQECGAQSPKWLGRCAECGAWNSMRRGAARRSRAGARRRSRYSASCLGGRRKLYAEVETANAVRLSTGIGEFDRVLGGGIVPGSLVLLGGEPGIGKSTLLLQAAAHFARAVGPVLYASGEESEHQIKSRGDRLGVGEAPLYLLAETCIERILERSLASSRRWSSSTPSRRCSRSSSSRRQAASARCGRQPPSSSSQRRGRTFRQCSSVTSRKTAALPVPRCSSTWWTRCSISRASGITHIAWCER